MDSLPPKPTIDLRRVLRGAAPLGAAIAVLGAGLFGGWPFSFRAPETEATEVPVAPAPKPFPSVAIEAQSAIVVDLTSGRVLFEQDADAPRGLASITKLVTAIVASERLSPEAAVRIASATETEEGPSFVLPPQPIVDLEGNPVLGPDGQPLFYEAQQIPGPTIVHQVPVVAKVKDAIAYALVASSNEASAALAREAGPGEATFVAEMNAAAARAGATTMRFENASGLDIGARPSAVGSARDVAAILAYLAKNRPDLLAPTAEPTVTVPTDRGPLTARNTNRIVATLPNLVGGKTGLTDAAGGNLAVVVDPGLGQPIAIVVLGSTEAGRFADVSALADATVAYLGDAPAPVAAR